MGMGMTRRTFVRFVAPMVLAVGGLAGAASSALAFDAIGASANFVSSSCTSPAVGQACTYTFHFREFSGQPMVGCPATFTGAPGAVNPTGAVTDSSGNVSTQFTASAAGPAVVAVSCSGVSASTSPTIVAAAGGTPNTGIGLPNTGTSAPGANPALFLGLGLAVMVLLGGAVSLRRSRRTAS
jgi:hypothetical protein